MDWNPLESPQDKVDRYIAGVLSGDIVTGEYVRKAVQRHVDDFARDSPFYFSEEIASAACAFFPYALRHYNGEWVGQPFALSDNQAFIVWCLWGWRRRSDDTRRFRSAYLTAARKWGKSTFCAGLMLLATCCDFPPEAGAENYCVATKEDQAKIVHGVAVKIRARSPAVQEYTETKTKLIKTLPGSPQPDSILLPIGSDSNTSDGFNTHLVVMDEVHAWGARHQGLYDRMTTAGGSRRQPLTIIITTAGDENSEIWKRRDAASVAVLDAAARGDQIGDNHFAFIARIDAKDDPFDPEVWPKANPNYPVTPKHDYLQEQADECQHNAVERSKFTRFHANKMVSSISKGIADHLWKSASGDLSDWNKADFIGGGFDLGGWDDLAAAARVARFDTGEVEDDRPVYRYEIDVRSFIEENSRRDLGADPWASFVAAGELSVVSNSISEIEAYLLSNDCDGVAFDPNNARKSGNDLNEERGEEWAVSMPQTAGHFNEPINAFLKALKDGRIRHNGDKVLAWAISNLHFKENQRSEKIPAKPSADAKIDPAVAVLMAFRMALFAVQEDNTPVIY
jgi:phage terminase large subunit-like protein